MDNEPLEAMSNVKLRGVYMTADFKWTTHINHICSKASKRLYALRILKRNGVVPNDLLNVYRNLIRPILKYILHCLSLEDQIIGLNAVP